MVIKILNNILSDTKHIWDITCKYWGLTYPAASLSQSKAPPVFFSSKHHIFEAALHPINFWGTFPGQQDRFVYIKKDL